MNPASLQGLTEQFTQLIGPEAFAKATAAVAAHAAAAAAAAAAKLAPAPVAAAPKPVAASPAATPSAAGVKPALPPAAAAATAAPKPVPTPAPAAPPPPPATPLLATDHVLKGYDLDATVAAHQVVAAAQILDQAGFALDAITGVDWMAQNEMEVVYDFFHPVDPLRVVVRARVPRADSAVPTISGVFAGANWHERETHDFFGIRFVGHPNMKPFLLPEDANFHPLRKDYVS